MPTSTTHGAARNEVGRRQAADHRAPSTRGRASGGWASALAQVGDVARPSLSGREPLLVTLKLVDGLASLRANRLFRRVLASLVKAKERFDTRIVHFPSSTQSAQSDHVHLLVATTTKSALSRTMKGLAVRLARAVNRELGRSGAVLRDRYHARLLATPRQTRNAIAYVLCNARKHGHAPSTSGWIDRCSSAGSFAGWSTAIVSQHPVPTAASLRTWLLRIGWRRGGGLLHPDHRPEVLPS